MPSVPAKAVMRVVDDDREWGPWHEAAEERGQLWDNQQPDPLKNLNIHLELVLVSDEGSSKATAGSTFSVTPVIVVLLIALLVFLVVKYFHVACLWCIRRRIKKEAEFCREQSEDLDASTVSTSPISRDVTAPVHRVSIPNDITVLDEEKKGEEGARERQEEHGEQPGLEERQDQFLEMLEGGKVYQTTNQDWDLSYGSFEKKKIFRSKSEAVHVKNGSFSRQIFDIRKKDEKLGYDDFVKKNIVTE